MAARHLQAGALRFDPLEDRVYLDGVPLSLSGKPVAVLRTLMESPGVLVTKSRLFDEVWGGVAVSDSVLTTAVRTIRSAIGDDARQPRIIETVHRKGYRFLLPVEEVAAVGPFFAEAATAEVPAPHFGTPRPARGTLTLILLAVLAIIAIAAAAWTSDIWRHGDKVAAPGSVNAKSIAVLPIRDLSSDGSARWFAAGLTQELMLSLVKVPDLQVSAPASAARMAASTDVLEAARRQSIAHVLEGSVRRTDGRTRVIVQLVRVADGATIWSENYDRTGSDAIRIQEDLAISIASSLKTIMRPDQLRAMLAIGTRNVAAYEAYVRGIAADQRQLDEGVMDHARAASDAYEEARRLDPAFASAHWKAARSWFGNATRVDSEVHSDVPEQERARRFFERVDAAIATSRDPIEALKYRAFAAAMRLRVREAQRLMSRYVEERPRDIDGWELFADIAAWAGDRAATADAARRVHRLSIESGEPRSRAVTLSVMALDLPTAVAQAEEQMRLRPDGALLTYQAHRAYIWSGRAADARRLMTRLEASDLPLQQKELSALRQACAEGRFALARSIEARLRQSDTSTRWQAEQILGDKGDATELLRPYDRAGRLPILLQYTIDPSFDVNQFPVLRSALLQGERAITPPREMPFNCQGKRQEVIGTGE